MYQASTPRFANILRNLSTLLDKAEAHCATKKIDPLALTTYRLFPDMFPLTRQVQIACDTAKGAVARLAGVDIPKHEDTEQTFADLKARIAKTRAFAEGVAEAGFAGSEDRDLTIQAGPRTLEFKGLPFLVGYALPNLNFHMSMAYAILRHNRVDLGKQDYIGPA